MTFNPINLFNFFVLLFAISIHEASHAWMANKCGDPTAAHMGRITLNPIPHIDLIGTIIIPLTIMIFSPGFSLIGWGKPCPVNPLNYRNYRRDDILVSIAGVASNFLAAFVSLLLLKVFILTGLGYQGVYLLLRIMYFINLVLVVFNLIPIPPLDGSHIVVHFLSEKNKAVFASIEQWGFLILIILVNTPLFDKFFGSFIILFDNIFRIVI